MEDEVQQCIRKEHTILVIGEEKEFDRVPVRAEQEAHLNIQRVVVHFETRIGGPEECRKFFKDLL